MIERRYAEFRADGGAVTGVVMPYGVASTIGRFTETFLAGAFNPLGDEIRANLQHVRSRPLARNVQGGGLVLQDSEIELRAALELPGTETGREARELIERRVLTGFSAEFNVKPGGESWRGTDRTIRAATLHAISLVDSPAHVGAQIDLERRWREHGGQSAELRQDPPRRLSTLRGVIPVDSLVDCRCQPGDCVSALFRRGSLAGVTSEDRLRDLLAITGEYADAVASTKRKTVRFWYDRDGSMQFAIDLPDNDRGRRFMELFDTVDTFARPVIDTAASEFTKDGAVAVYARAEVRALTLGPTDAAAGWTPLRELTGPDDDLPNNLPAPAPEPRRRIWL